MSEKKEVVSLDQKQFQVLAAIVIDQDKEAALKFLEEEIYNVIQGKKVRCCHGSVRCGG